MHTIGASFASRQDGDVVSRLFPTKPSPPKMGGTGRTDDVIIVSSRHPN
jgi:hypothetical protein